MTLIWLVLGLPCAAAVAVVGARPFATAIARATTLVTALLATMLALGAPLGAAAALPWIPERGLRFAFALDPLAIPGILTVAWLSALASGHARGRNLALLLLGEAAAMAAWLAGDLVTMVAAWSLLAILAAAMVGRSRQSMMAVFLPLSAAAAALLITALGLAHGHHEATVGLWSFDLGETLGVLVPAGTEAVLAASSLIAAWLISGVWPLHGWWRRAAEEAPPAFAAWLPAVLRPLGIGLLIRVTLSAAPTTLAVLAPLLAIAGGLSILAGLLGMGSERTRDRWHLHLAHIPVGLGLLGISTLTPEGISGALLLGLGGGLAFALAQLGAQGAHAPVRRIAGALGLLGLLGAPGLLSFAGALPIGLATLGQGSWLLPWPLLFAFLVLCAPVFAIPSVIAAARAPAPTPVQPAAPSLPRAALVSLAAGSVALVLLGLAPGLVQDRVTSIAPTKMLRFYQRWCTVALTPLQRARPMTVAADGCERGMATLRAQQGTPAQGRDDDPAPASAPPPERAEQGPVTAHNQPGLSAPPPPSAGQARAEAQSAPDPSPASSAPPLQGQDSVAASAGQGAQAPPGPSAPALPVVSPVPDPSAPVPAGRSTPKDPSVRPHPAKEGGAP